MRGRAAELVSMLQQRSAVLARLLAGPTEPRTLAEASSVSRSTIDRALEELHDGGLIDRDSESVWLTLFGRLIITVYDDFDTHVARVAEQTERTVWRTDAERAEALGLLTDRLSVLECTRMPRDKRTLVAELDSSRSTVDRAIRELEIAGLVERTADGYTMTPIGQQATEQYRATLETIADVLSARDVLDHLPATCVFSPSLLVGSDIKRVDPATPYRLLPGVRERLDAADRVRVVLPVLPNPQLLDCCHQRVVRHGATLSLVTDQALCDTLTREFPGPLSEMVAAVSGTFTAHVGDIGPFGLVLVDTDAGTRVTVIVYADRRSVYGAIHTDTDSAIEWAKAYYERVREEATEIPDDQWEPSDLAPLSTVADPGRVEREAEGFVRLTPEYFAQRAPAPPATGWRAGFDLVDVHAGYAIDREGAREGTRYSLTDEIDDHLEAGTDTAVIGPPGSGKSTVCKSIACRWYEQGNGPVFYRESGTGVTFDAQAILAEQLRAATADGHVLVVVEDAVRAEANTIFRVMQAFRGNQNVTFLLDARAGEWQDPASFPTDARLDAYRTEHIERVAMPALDDRECERIVQHFTDTVGYAFDVSTEHLLRGTRTETTDAPGQETRPAELLLVLHRLALHTDPLADDDARTPTTLTEDVQRTYEELHVTGETALDVGVLVNLLNAAGSGVTPALVYALCDDSDDEDIRDALSTLDGRIIFEREGGDDASYRTVHETWSELFLEQLLDDTDEHVASRRFGRCVTALLALADDETRRVRSKRAVGGDAPVLDRIERAPGEWADATTERLFQLGLNRPRLAPLFGTSEHATIELPAVCSSVLDPRCAQWRGEMYVESGNPDRAERELERALDRVATAETNHSDQLTDVSARCDRYLGAIAHGRGAIDTAKEFYEQALDSYCAIDDRLGEADCHNLLGSVAVFHGDFDHAEVCYERSLAIRRDLDGPLKKRTKPLNNLGVIAALRGEFDRAEEYFERSVDIGRDLTASVAGRELNVSFGLAQALFNLGDISRKRGDLDLAEEHVTQGHDIVTDISYPTGIAIGQLAFGRIAFDRGDLDRAEEYVQRSLDTFREIEELRYTAGARIYLGRIARNRGDLDDAEEHLTDALALGREGDHRTVEAGTLEELGKLARDRDQPARAREYFVDAVEIFREMGALRDAITCLERLAATCETLGNTAEARTHYETAASLAQEAGFDELHASVTEQL